MSKSWLRRNGDLDTFRPQRGLVGALCASPLSTLDGTLNCRMAYRGFCSLRALAFITYVLCNFDISAQWKFDAYPDYLEVLDRLYGKHRVVHPGCVPKLAKMPDGWWLMYDGVDSVEVRHQLWSYQKQKYLRPDLPKLARGEAPTAMQAFQNSDWTASYYRACPYFGYRGWFLDVIEEYGDAKGLPAFAQYGVARAYSNAARALLDDLQSDAPAGYSFPKDPDDAIGQEDLDTYLGLFRSGCTWFTSLAQEEPSFETHVGEIALKRDHEFMTGYMDLLMAGEDSAARECVPADAYEPFYRNIAKAYLASCDSNAILFTNGDTDTYPLWYVQVIEGYRCDVLVLNLSLLNAPGYVEAMRQGHLGSVPADWQLPESFYSSDLSGYARLGTDKDTMDLRDVIDIFRLAGRSSTENSGGELGLSTHCFQLNGPDSTTIAWKVPKDHVLRSAIAVFDLLAHQAADRPIHWAVSTGPDSFYGLVDHMGLQGFTYKLVFDAPTAILRSASATPTHVLEERSAELFLDVFEWDEKDAASINKTRLVTNAILQVSNTVEALAAAGDTATALALLHRYVELFPNERWSYDRIMIRPIELLWNLNDGVTADSLARILVQNLKTRPDVFGPVDDPTSDDRDLAIREAVIDRLHTTSMLHQRDDFLRFLENQPTTWPDPLVVKQRWSGSAETRPRR